MTSRDGPASDYFLRQAAYLASLGLSNTEIANLLNSDAPKVSKTLKEAREKGFLVEIRKYVEQSGVTPVSLEEFFSEHKIARELYLKLKSWEDDGIPGASGRGRPFVRPQLYVLSSGEDLNSGLAEDIPFDAHWTPHAGYNGWDVDKDRSDRATCHFTKLAFEPVLRELESCGSAAVCWGRTLNALLEKAPQERGWQSPIRSHAPCVVIPLWGEAWKFYHVPTDSKLFPNRQALSSTHLAQCLARLLNGDAKAARSLQAAPALIPREMLPHAEVIKRFFGTQGAYDEIFGKGDMASRVDAILATVGVPDCHYRFWSDELLGSLGLSAEDFGDMVLGDVGGVLIERPGISARQKDMLKEIKACWLGVQMAHLRKCFERGRPGVIVLAFGALRAKVVLYLLLHRLANVVLIDRSLAQTLIHLMDHGDKVQSLLAVSPEL